MTTTIHPYSHLAPINYSSKKDKEHTREIARDVRRADVGEKRYVAFTNCRDGRESLEHLAATILGTLGKQRDRFYVYAEQQYTLSPSSSAWWLIVERRAA